VSKSIIYTVNSSGATVPVNGTIPFGTIVRKYGCNLNSADGSIIARGEGYYEFHISLSVIPAAAGTITATLLADGVAVVGGKATATAVASSPLNFGIDAVQRLQCCDSSTTFTLLISGVGAAISNVSTTVNKC
jgi:hypothetical protein